VEWLVKMRRLPAEKMLDRLIAGGKVEAADLRRVADLLSVFYQRAPRVTLTEEGYRLRFVRDVEEIDRELREISPIPEERIAAVSAELLGFTRNRADLLLARARERRIVEAHGDLRPEHVCCLSPPVVIDCLEFAPELRALDPADELSFLTVECELAGGVLNPSAARAERVAEREPWGWGPTAVTEAPLIERILFEAYTARNLDRPEALLVRFYKAFRAFVRAKIAIWHLRDPDVKDASRWVSKADRYVEAAARLVRPSPDSPESFS
jgi:aminoglycoside phosphotransferase family enzyme